MSPITSNQPVRSSAARQACLSAGLLGLGCVQFISCTGTGTNPARISYDPPRVPTLGAVSDAVWQDQEVNAEAAKFVVYMHEFQLNTTRLNTAGEDHIKQIAARLQEGTPFPVVVERSMNNRGRGTYDYPVHPNPALDDQRREVVVSALRLMGVDDADQRVVVAPAFTESATSQEAEAAFLRGLEQGQGGNGFSGGFGGFGGGGVF